MGVFDNINATTTAPSKGVFSSVSTAPAAKSGGVFANVSAAPKTPVAAVAAPSGYFEGKEPSGTFVGIGDTKDPFSGRPYLAYRVPGATATTTDYTRVASKNNPEVAVAQPRKDFTNDRMPESASQAIRARQNATAQEQLDHRMALALGGSNNSANLKLIPSSENQAASGNEGKYSADIAAGTMSLFEAQTKEAQEKGLPAPFVDDSTPAPKKNLLDTIATAPDNSLTGIFRNTILGLPAAVKTVAKATAATVAGVAEGIVKQYTDPSPLEKSMEANMKAPGPLAPIASGVLRTIVPMVEPLVNDATSAVIFNQPELYSDLVQKITTSGPDTFTKEIVDPTQKTPTQIVGDTAQAVLGAYFPEVFGDSMEAFAAKGLLPAIGNSVVHGGTAGFAFGVAQAASSGSKDPKEIASTIIQSTIAGAMLNLVVAGASHAAGATIPKVVSAIADRLPKTLEEAQRGFIKVPGVDDEVERKKDTEKDASPAEELGAIRPAPKETPTPTRDNTPNIQKLLDAFDNSKNQVPVGDSDFVLGDYGKNAIERKTSAGQEDRLPVSDLEGTTPHIKDTFKAGDTNFRKDNTVHVAEMPDGETRAIVSRMNKDGEQEVINFFKVGRDVKTFKENLEKFGTPGESRTRIPSLERSGSDPLSYGDKTTVPKEDEVSMGTQEGVPKPTSGSGLTDLALQAKTPNDFYMALTDDEQQRVLQATDPDGTGLTTEEAAHSFFAKAKENIGPRDQELPQSTRPGGKATDRQARPIRQILQEEGTKTQERPLGKNRNPSGPLPQRNQSYDPVIEEHNGGVKPPENKGGLEAPEADWSTGKEISAVRQSTDTLERTFEKIFPKKLADTLNKFTTEANRHNEAERVRFVTDVRKETQAYVVKELGIKPATAKSAWVQRLGEGRVSLDELKKAMPQDWANIKKASDFFRGKYDQLIDMWNRERTKAGLKPINKRPNYFRHFIDLTSFAHMYGLDFRESALPTAISGMTEFFRSQSPWTNAAMRRLGSETTDDAVGGFDNYLDSTSRAIFHTDTVQRGRLVDKYLRNAADANAHAAQDIRDSGEQKEIPPAINLPRLANTLKQWTDTVSGKQNIFDRSLESMVGRPVLGVMRAITRQFGLNVIGGNVGAAVTHAIPMVYTLATVDKGAAFHGLYGTLTSPFLEDFRKIDGTASDFLTRRFGKEEIQRGVGEKIGATISAPFHWVDQFISRFAVESKYHEGIAKGMTPAEAMKAADNYASRVIGDRSAGNLPPIMSTKTLGWLTQFQIEVNDNLRVLVHDIPRWEGGSVPKIANRIVQFAMYSYLFNQTMQYVKGSGKGLDPIDMGLTLAGLNDEGHDESLTQRLESVGGDFLKEMPFTSIATGGQIPALQPLTQAISDAANGAPLKALEGVLASFASPVGGGQQLQKSLTAIQAWRQGYVTDSRGNITATVPHTIPTLAQGVLFGKSAFATVKKSNTEIGNLDATLKEGQAASKLKNTQADNIWQQLKGMPQDEAKQQLVQIAASDPDMAKRVIQSAKDDAAGITKQDTLLKTLGVTNGDRAKYIVGQLQDMSTNEEKKAYLSDLATKKILTAAVLAQVASLLKK